MEERFFCKVNVGSGEECWDWLAGKDTWGYGIFCVNKKNRGAHRVSWEIANGEIPHGLSVLHKCDNPKCVNPAHLFLGTHTDNMRDMVAKGRMKRHTNRAKVSISQVSEIRDRYEKGLMTRKQISQKYGICDRQVGRIVKYENWLTGTV